MEFKDWIKQRYVDWRGPVIGNEKSLTEFSTMLGFDKATLSLWIKGKRSPGKLSIKQLAIHFPEVYEIFGFQENNINVGISIPLLGRIAAGTAIAMPHSDFSMFGPESVVTVLRDWLPPNSDTSKFFALEVEGDSMQGEGIHDGDTIIMRKAQTAENGDLVAVRIDDDDSVTLKKFYRENGTVRLQPANSKMKPIKVAAEKVHIEGKIVISIRRWK